MHLYVDSTSTTAEEIRVFAKSRGLDVAVRHDPQWEEARPFD
jgi:hypothetical protein